MEKYIEHRVAFILSLNGVFQDEKVSALIQKTF